MRGDFSRLTWDRRKHYAAVLMQQGRLQVDADWNEQIDIIMHRLETEVADYVGHSGVPARAPHGFRIQAVPGDDGRPGLRVGAGRIYVEGRLIENESEAAVPLAEESISGARRAVVYLDTWQRVVSFAEDPDIREVALGGPDTAARLQNAWRVRVAPANDGDRPANVPPDWQPDRIPISTGLLTARVAADLPSLENQLYRIEVHSATEKDVTFTWSRDNGSVGARVTDVQPATRTLSIEGGGRDADAAVAGRQWAELLTEAQAEAGERGPVVRIDRAAGDQVVITEASWPWAGDQAPAIRVLRRWDDPAGLVTAPLVASGADDGGWVPLESGIEVRFETAPDGGNEYVPGDYWLVPARHDTASIEWPSSGGNPAAQPAHGVRHTYAALALLERDADGAWSVVEGGDLRPLVSPLDDGFVSKGDGGDVMRGPLSVQPLLRAAYRAQELVALRVAPAFDDAGQAEVRHTALRVTGGDIVLGTPDQPVSTVASGSLTVQGTVSATEVRVDTGLSIQGTLTVDGLVGEGGSPAEAAVRIGALEVANGAAPDAGFLRFGDRTGWKFHIGRSREAADAPHNAGTTGAILTVADEGYVGINTTTPRLPLHVGARSFGGLAVSGLLVISSVRTFLKNAATPAATVLYGLGEGAGFAREGVYFFWKNSAGQRKAAILQPDPDLTSLIETG